MKYLLISNMGEVIVEALTLVGASTKRNDEGQIGMFGSGNKYAMAYFLRNGINPIVYSGKTKVDIGTVGVEMRGNIFDVITINGEKTSITTQMGHHWKLWMAIREVYANAIDEGLVEFDTVEDIKPIDGQTQYYIPINDEVSDFIFNIDDYFSKNKKVLFESENGKILKKHSDKARIYRRGILVYESNETSSFDYDLYNVPINEDRQINYSWYIWEEMYKILHACDNESIIRSVLQNQSHTLEGSISSVSTISFDYLNDAWDNVMKDKYACPIDMGGYVKDDDRGKTYFLNGKLYNAIVGCMKKNINPNSMCRSDNGTFYQDADSDMLFEKLIPVMDFFSDCKLHIKHEIHFAKFNDPDTFGLASDNKIFLSSNIFDRGNHFVVNVIIEEEIHLNSGAGDNTRAFQNAAINMFIDYIERINGLKI